MSRLVPVVTAGLFVACTYGLADLHDDEASRPNDTASTNPWVTLDTADTDTDTETYKDDTGDPVDPGELSPPVIEAFSISESGSWAVFDMTVTDVDDDLEGGEATITAGTTSRSYRWPDDLTMSSSTRASVSWDLTEFEPDRSTSVKLAVLDATGKRDSWTESFTRSTPTYTASEVGDGMNDVVDLGVLDTPSVIEGTIHGCGNTRAGTYAEDVDIFRFKPSTGGTSKLRLTWGDKGVSDLDIYLLSNSDDELARSTTIYYPENIEVNLTGGTSYKVFVACWEGTPGSWEVRYDLK